MRQSMLNDWFNQLPFLINPCPHTQLIPLIFQTWHSISIMLYFTPSFCFVLLDYETAAHRCVLCMNLFLSPKCQSPCSRGTWAGECGALKRLIMPSLVWPRSWRVWVGRHWCGRPWGLFEPSRRRHNPTTPAPTSLLGMVQPVCSWRGGGVDARSVVPLKPSSGCPLSPPLTDTRSLTFGPMEEVMECTMSHRTSHQNLTQNMHFKAVQLITRDATPLAKKHKKTTIT